MPNLRNGGNLFAMLHLPFRSHILMDVSLEQVMMNFPELAMSMFIISASCFWKVKTKI